MVAPAALYTCTACNASVRKWMPRCPTCGALGSVRGANAAALATNLPGAVDIAPAVARVPAAVRALPSASDRRDAEDPDDDDAEEFPGDEPIAITEVPADAYQRISTGIPPLDRVLGGGLVVGSIVLLGGDPGAGKCLGAGTPVIMEDGSTRAVESISIGDRVMGPDGRGRAVLATNAGRAPLYRIVPTRGEPWVCNGAHVLTLVHSITDEIFDIELSDYLAEAPQGRMRAKSKLFSVGVDRFACEHALPVDPYFLGLWFGDGTKETRNGRLCTVAITKPDPAVAAACRAVADAWGLRVTTWTNSTACPTHSITPGERRGPGGNRLLTAMQDLLGADLAMPAAYLRAPRAQRLAFLAGLLDSDGYLCNGVFEITQRRRDWADAIWWLARSLGFCSIRTSKRGTCTLADGTIFEGEYWRVSISGETSEIPTRIARKRATARQQIKIATRTGFAVESIGNGDYYGFHLDGDGRFLLGDFTVTHNSTLLVQVAALLACGTVLYASGEESAGQVADRARRVDAARPHIQIVRESRLERILDLAERRGARVLVVDSVHTLTTEYASGITGSVTQVRECTARLMAFAKATGIVVIVIGHITKDGSLAGPKTLEHLVDAVLLLSAYGDAEMADTPYRTLRSFKNRFGDTTERGHFEMRPSGLAEAFLLPGDDGLHEELVPVAQELLNRYRRLGGHVDEGLRDRIAGRLDCDGDVSS